MRAREIHAAASELVDEPLLWKSVKAALSADVTGEHPRFRRVRHGVYQLARDVRRCTSWAALPTRSPRWSAVRREHARPSDGALRADGDIGWDSRLHV